MSKKTTKFIVYENIKERVICTPATEKILLKKFKAWGYNMNEVEEDEDGDFTRYELDDNFIVMTPSGLDNIDVESNFEELPTPKKKSGKIVAKK